MTLERILVVGLGSIGRRHARIARQIMPNVEITALRHRECPDVPESGIDHCVTTIDDALRLRPECAVLASPATHHLDVAGRLADAGVHLLVEKPIAGSSAGVAELIELARVREVVLMTGYNLRFLPSLQHFRTLLAEQRVGRVLSVRAEMGQFLPGWRPGSDYRQTVSARAALGGGVLRELSHEFDYLRWLFGEVDWISAVVRRQGALEIDVEDTAHLTLGFLPDDEGRAVVATLNMDFLRHDTTRTCTVIGDGGSLRWNAITGVVDVFEPGSSSWGTLFEQLPHRDESYLAEWRHFLACISGERQPMVSGADGLAVLRIIEAARRSAETKAVVHIREDRALVGRY